MQTETDFNIRMATFGWLSDITTQYGDVLPRSLLQKGFEYHGQRIPLVSPQGIFKPQTMSLPLSITSTPKDLIRISSDQMGCWSISTAELIQTTLTI